MAITQVGERAYTMIVDEWRAEVDRKWRNMMDWQAWKVERKKKVGPWVLTHLETGHTVTSNDRRKAEKKMREFHRAHRRMVESWP